MSDGAGVEHLVQLRQVCAWCLAEGLTTVLQEGDGGGDPTARIRQIDEHILALSAERAVLLAAEEALENGRPAC